jgi:drug/metabolite transporter (DMT)-like permease
MALVSICFFWGTTYLVIRMALESVPPLFLVSGRFLLSGSMMLAAAWWAGIRLPRGRDLLWTSINGVLILGIGNGCLVFAETWIPSSLAALFISISPFWMVGLEAAVPGGEKLRLPVLAGMIAGLAGAAILVGPGIMDSGFSGNTWKGFLILQLGSASWGLGSILQKRHRSQTHPVINGAIQQLAAGLAFAVPTLVSGQLPNSFHWKGMGAVLYLVIFGSIVGYSSYIYALDRLPVSLVSIYTYINPVVAAILGWMFYREPFGRREIIAMAIIFCGVAIVKTSGRFTPFRVPWRPVPRRLS